MPSIIGLLAFLLLLLVLGWMFALTVIEIFVNGIILYLLGVRTLREIDRGLLREYGIGFVVALIVLAAGGNVFGFLWWLTTFVVMWFIVAQIARLVLKK